MKIGPRGGASKAFMKALTSKKPCNEMGEEAFHELERMLGALRRDAHDLFHGSGAFRCRKKLADGTVVTFSIKRPTLPIGKEGARTT